MFTNLIELLRSHSAYNANRIGSLLLFYSRGHDIFTRQTVFNDDEHLAASLNFSDFKTSEGFHLSPPPNNFPPGGGGGGINKANKTFSRQVHAQKQYRYLDNEQRSIPEPRHKPHIAGHQSHDGSANIRAQPNPQERACLPFPRPGSCTDAI